MRRDELLVAEMIEAAEQAIALTTGITTEALYADRQRRDADAIRTDTANPPTTAHRICNAFKSEAISAARPRHDSRSSGRTRPGMVTVLSAGAAAATCRSRQVLGLRRRHLHPMPVPDWWR